MLREARKSLKSEQDCRNWLGSVLAVVQTGVDKIMRTAVEVGKTSV